MALVKLFLAILGCSSLALAGGDVASKPCGSKTYTYNELAGFGFLPAEARDKFGDTMSIGSAIAVKDWKKTGRRSYRGTFYGLPDRGWNTNGTQNTIPRIHIFDISFTAEPGASVSKPSGPNLEFEYKTTILLKGPDGTPMTGLEPDLSAAGSLTYKGFPAKMPTATYPGDGFGGPGSGGKRLCIDAEGLVLGDDGSFWISDEYGPFLFKFDKTGKLVAAQDPPAALLPIRNNEISFSSDTPPIYNSSASAGNPSRGRQNNQGYEGLTVSPDGKSLWVMLQSAARHEGGRGGSSSTRTNARFLKYSIKESGHKEKSPSGLEYEAEYVVPLPKFSAAAGQLVAAQSEIHYISDTQFLVLPRDSGAGRGPKPANNTDAAMADAATSKYRHVDVVDISKATNIKDMGFDGPNGSITTEATSEQLKPGIVPATLCPFLDFNINSELNKFTAKGAKLHNGLPVDVGLLNEKWEGLALLPVNDVKGGRDEKDEYYLIAISDNDFISDKGFMNLGQIPFVDKSGSVPFLDSQALVFKITLPKGSKPLIG